MGRAHEGMPKAYKGSKGTELSVKEVERTLALLQTLVCTHINIHAHTPLLPHIHTNSPHMIEHT